MATTTAERPATAAKAVDSRGKGEAVISVAEPNMGLIKVRIRGTAPLVQNKFSLKARLQMMAAMATPKSQKKAKSERPPRNYDDDFVQAQHISVDGWNGLPAVAFRAAMISACRVCGIVMTRAKLVVFIEPDGLDKDDGTPLVRIIADPPERYDAGVRNDNGGADIRCRPMWRKWEAVVSIRYDMDMIDTNSVISLLHRAGIQVGIGEGRPDSKNSVGQGFGTFEIVKADND